MGYAIKKSTPQHPEQLLQLLPVHDLPGELVFKLLPAAKLKTVKTCSIFFPSHSGHVTLFLSAKDIKLENLCPQLRQTKS